MTLIWAGLIVGVSLIIVLWFQRREADRRRQSLMSLVITLSGTFAGVFLALYLSNWHAEQGERQQLSEILNAVEAEAQHRLTSVGALMAVWTQLQLPHPPFDMHTFVGLHSLDMVLMNPLSAKHIPRVATRLYFVPENLGTLTRPLNDPDEDLGARFNALEYYEAEMKFVIEVSTVARAYLGGDIGLEELEEELVQLLKERLEKVREGGTAPN